jgi:hypothetical protein
VDAPAGQSVHNYEIIVKASTEPSDTREVFICHKNTALIYVTAEPLVERDLSRRIIKLWCMKRRTFREAVSCGKHLNLPAELGSTSGCRSEEAK